MSLPISSVIANIFMEHFKKEVLRKTLKKPKVWFRFIDRFVDIRDMKTRQSHKSTP